MSENKPDASAKKYKGSLCQNCFAIVGKIFKATYKYLFLSESEKKNLSWWLMSLLENKV